MAQATMNQSQEAEEEIPGTRLAELVEENSQLRRETYRLQLEVEEYRVQLASGGGPAGSGPGGGALRWQLGDALVRGLSRPGWATLRIPDRIIRVLWAARRKRRYG